MGILKSYSFKAERTVVIASGALLSGDEDTIEVEFHQVEVSICYMADPSCIADGHNRPALYENIIAITTNRVDDWLLNGKNLSQIEEQFAEECRKIIIDDCGVNVTFGGV